MGTILGDDGYEYEVEGDDILGDEEEYEMTEGAGIALPVRRAAAIRRPALRMPARRGTLLHLPPKPAWRKKELAPGVQQPGELMQPLPLAPDLNGGVFDAGNMSILFSANPQRPYQPQRLVIDFTQVPTSVVQLRISYMTVGVDVQSVQIGDMPASAFKPTAFGVRMKLRACQPGVLVQVRITAQGAFAVGPPAEAIPCAVLFLGHAIA